MTIEQLNEKLTGLEQECAKLKIDASNHAYQCDRAKQERDKAEAENSSLRAENERLKKDFEDSDHDNRINAYAALELRKRCEDLEAAVRALIDVSNPDDIDAYEAINKANELLSQ